MNVLKYLETHTVEQLHDEFAVILTHYPDRVVLNYDQIDSPRFHPVVDECRALILRKPHVNGKWEVLARSFNRFYNIGEGHSKGFDHIRVAADVETVILYDFSGVRIQTKLDGSLMSVYHDGNDWQVSTRKMAFAEGQTSFGRTFAQLFWDAAKKYDLKNKLNTLPIIKAGCETLVFELTGPENRVVTPYSDSDIALLTIRNNGDNGRECIPTHVDLVAQMMNVPRPKLHRANDANDIVNIVCAFPTMEEGVVLILDAHDAKDEFLRIKCKNPQFVAIAHMRENGGISPKNVLRLVMVNEHHEYLQHFECDAPYFIFVEDLYSEMVARIQKTYDENKDIQNQKDFALAIIPQAIYAFEKGVMFSLRKEGGTVRDKLKNIGSKKISDAINLKQKFIDKFHVIVEDEDDV